MPHNNQITQTVNNCNKRHSTDRLLELNHSRHLTTKQVRFLKSSLWRSSPGIVPQNSKWRGSRRIPEDSGTATYRRAQVCRLRNPQVHRWCQQRDISTWLTDTGRQKQMVILKYKRKTNATPGVVTHPKVINYFRFRFQSQPTFLTWIKLNLQLQGWQFIKKKWLFMLAESTEYTFRWNWKKCA